MVTIYGEKLPDDALPTISRSTIVAAQRLPTKLPLTLRLRSIPNTVSGGNFSDPLTELDKNFNVATAAAESWEVAEDGVTWSFHLRPGQVWSDGTPLTAHDWVATFQIWPIQNMPGLCLVL